MPGGFSITVSSVDQAKGTCSVKMWWRVVCPFQSEQRVHVFFGFDTSIVHCSCTTVWFCRLNIWRMRHDWFQTVQQHLSSPWLDSLFILTHFVHRHLLLITEMTLTYKGKEESSSLSTAQMLVHFRVHILFFKPPKNMKWLCRQLRSVSLEPNLISFRKRSLSKLCSLKTLLEFASLISSNLIRHQQLSLFISLCCCSHSRKICYSLCPDLMHLFFSFCSGGCEFTLSCGCIVLWRWSSLRPFHFTDQA